MKPIFLFSILIFLLLTGTTCKNSPTESNCTDCPTEPDTTSHNFIWSLDTLGAEGSVVNDVAVISENDIWAVGRFYKESYNAEDPYNVVHWNGLDWSLIKVPFIIGEPPTPRPHELRAIKSFSSNEIIVTDGGDLSKYNGTSWQQVNIPSEVKVGSYTRIWGESSSKLYFGGTNGSLTYWDGVKFTKLETGTNLPIQDMEGVGDSLYLTASNYGSGQTPSKLFKIQVGQESVKELSQSGLQGNLKAIWILQNYKWKLISSGYGLFEKSDTSWKSYNLLNTSLWAVLDFEGSENNLWAVGGHYLKLHYNGKSWKNLTNEVPILDSGNFGRVSMKGNIVVIIGYSGSVSYLVKGIQQ